MNKKQKKMVGMLIGLIIILIALGIWTALGFTGQIGKDFALFLDNPVPAYAMVDVSVGIPREEKIREYAYNERVPMEVQLDELYSLADRFGFSQQLTDEWVYCLKDRESGFNNLAKNPESTALGTCQYLIGTWQETESFKQFRKARTDYKACLWEMALDIANGEQWRWASCF